MHTALQISTDLLKAYDGNTARYEELGQLIVGYATADQSLTLLLSDPYVSELELLHYAVQLDKWLDAYKNGEAVSRHKTTILYHRQIGDKLVRFSATTGPRRKYTHRMYIRMYGKAFFDQHDLEAGQRQCWDLGFEARHDYYASDVESNFRMQCIVPGQHNGGSTAAFEELRVVHFVDGKTIVVEPLTLNPRES